MITNVIRVLPSYPRFTPSSAFYPHIRVLLSQPRFTLSSAFYSHIRVLPPHPSIRPSISPSVRPYPRFTLIPKIMRLWLLYTTFSFSGVYTRTFRIFMTYPLPSPIHNAEDILFSKKCRKNVVGYRSESIVATTLL